MQQARAMRAFCFGGRSANEINEKGAEGIELA